MYHSFLRAASLLFSSLLIPAAAYAQPLTFRVFAGSAGGPGFFDGYRREARFSQPEGIAVDRGGNVYVADTENHTIRMITVTGEVTTLAGRAGRFGHANGTGAEARFFAPAGVAVDAEGNVYVADTFNYAIRKITPEGVVSTLAGGSYGYSDGAGRSASFRHPRGVAIDGNGNVLVADGGNSAIRKITTDGVVTTLAGGNCCGPTPVGEAKALTVDRAGNIYIADRHSILKLNPSGTITTLAGSGALGWADGTGNQAKFNYPQGVAVDGSGNVYVADSSNHAIRKITPEGVVTTLAGRPPHGLGSADGTGSEAQFGGPEGVAVDETGNVYVAEAFNSDVRKVTPSGVVTTLAGRAIEHGFSNGNAFEARFSTILGLAVDAHENVYLADEAIRKITSAGIVSTLIGAREAGFGAYGGGPEAVAVDGSGNIYIADTHNHRIGKITPAGLVTNFAGSPGSMGSANGIGSVARFALPKAVATDRLGNIYVADSLNSTIRKIGADGNVSTFAGTPGAYGSADGVGGAARFSTPQGLAVTADGNVYVADTYNHTIRQITPDGSVSTFVGRLNSPGASDGQGNNATFNGPRWLASDPEGNLYTGEDSRVRRITPAGVVSTVGGVFGAEGTVEGTGAAARFSNATGVAVDNDGRLYVADGARIVRGEPALADVAVIDSPSGRQFQRRQLDTGPQTATTWNWTVVRRPAHSVAVLSSTSVRNPTFRPDVADLYVFRLSATNGTQTSISMVELDVTPHTGRRRLVRH